VRTLDFVEQAASAHLVVRPYGSDGVRVTIGAPEENNALLQFATGWI
jgi:histidinol-phosphate aminotransferase